MLRALIPLGTLTLFVSEALLITSAYLLATYLTLEVDPTVLLLYDGGLGQIGLVLASIVMGLHFHDLYAHPRVVLRLRLLQQLCFTIGCAFLAQGLLGYFNPRLRVPIRVMLLGSAIALPAIFAWRLVYNRYSLAMVARQRLLLFGGGGLLQEIGEFIEKHPERGLTVVGCVDDTHQPGTAVGGGKYLGRSSSLQEIVYAIRPDRLVVDMPRHGPWTSMKDLLELQLDGVMIEPATAAYERLLARVSINALRPAQLICSAELEPQERRLFYQNIAHVAVAVVLLALTLPLMLLIALAVRVTSAGPVLLGQKMAGLDGAPFTTYRFRTHAVNPGALPEAAWDGGGDPRLTRVGRILRRFRLDQLPQLFNVIRGEMSIVGPRPERPELVRALAAYIPFYPQRHVVRPGMTGWAQIKQETPVEDTLLKLEYDLYYVKNMSLFLDMYIVFYTFKAVLFSPAR
jgi:exopolysaccharide biosynthesis polyprenyl glycosylphosphotransferase